MREVDALREELDELDALLETLSVEDWERPTPFKAWTPWDVVAHLHLSDRQSVLALEDPELFRQAAAALGAALRSGTSLQEYTREQLATLDAPALRDAWRDAATRLCSLLDARGPRDRIPWFGPDMGVRMFTTARQMETWAHAQDLYDLLGRPRVYSDRLENIAVIGVKTFGWTFTNRKLPVPEVAPYVRLRAPSGATWEWNPPSAEERIEGDAAEFCHVVTQGRNVADTALEVVGEVATRWMAIAQCFAGAPSDPPAPGTRTGAAG